MHKYIPHSNKDIEVMLERIGVKSLSDLFNVIPKELLLNRDYNIPSYKDDYSLEVHMEGLATKNKQLTIFRGNGAYDHITPSIIHPLISRQEFLTSYTPYQPEVSQGTLHYIFEYQSMINELTKMEVSNASLYDGATALAEAMMMAYHHNKNAPIAVSSTISEKIIDVLNTYARFKNIELLVIPEENGVTKRKWLDEGEYSSVIVQNPNKYGIIEDYEGFSDYAHNKKGLFIMSMDPATLSHLKTPGELNADIAVGDGQTLGLPLGYGGPYIGYMAVTKKLIRKMPGRICGMTKDVDGKDGFVLTFQAREQHIRRDKANSNICSNQSLNALFVTIYLAVMGEEGLRNASQMSIDGAHYLYSELLKTNKFEVVFDQPFFKEFVLKAKFDLTKFNKYLEENGILGPDIIGNDLALFAVTEKRTKAEIDKLVELVVNFKWNIMIN